MRRKTSQQERQSKQLAKRRVENLGSTVNDLFQKASQNEQVLRRFQQFELQLLDVTGFASLLDTLLQDSLGHFQLDAVELCLYDPQHTLRELLSDQHAGLDNLKLYSQLEPLSRLYGNEPAVRMESVHDGKALPVFYGQGIRSAALLPLIRQGVLVGSLHFGALGHQRFAGNKSTDFISHLASVVSVCLENAVNQERLHRLSTYDMLTQVKNRRAFQLALDSEVSRALRRQEPLSLLFVDLDHFKQVNDNYGHPVGDRVLKTVAQYIDQMLRKTDHVCRYGGEEFAVLLPCCDSELALEIAERIRQQVSRLEIDDDKGGAISVTLSIGVSCWLATNVSPDTDEVIYGEQLLSCADHAVYRSKGAGRNCVNYLAVDAV